MFKRLLKKIRKVKSYKKLTLAEKVQVQESKVNMTLGVFADAYDELEKAEKEFLQVAEEAKREAEKLLKVSERAQDNCLMNQKAKIKIAEFIPGKE